MNNKNNLSFNHHLVLSTLSYFQSGVRNIGVFLSLSLVLFSFSFYFKDVNKLILGLIHLVSLFLIIIVAFIAHYLHHDTNIIKENKSIFSGYSFILSKWVRLIFSLKIVVFIIAFVFTTIILFDIRNLLKNK